MADGTSKSGEPKNPIDKKTHPHFATNKGIQKLPNDSPAFVWNEPNRLKYLQGYPYFKQQPDYAALMELTVKALELKDLNKKGKATVATQLISAGDKARNRMRNREVRS